MGSNIEEIKSNFTFGGARSNQFDVQVANKIDPSGDLKFKFTCKAAELPQAEIGEIDLFYRGRPIGLMGDRPPFPPWTVTVYNDEDFLVKNAFERWNSGMNEHQGNIMGRGVTPNPTSYKSDAFVTQYSKGGPVIKVVKFVGLWPKRIGNIILDWEDQNKVEMFEVEFKYDYWTSDTTDSF